MKYQLCSGIGVLALCFAVAPVSQISASEKPVAIVTPNIAGKAASASAFDLTRLAGNGYLQEQGIPSGSELTWEFKTGRITAQDIVQAGIRANRVSPEALNNPAYIQAIEYNLAEPRISD